MKRRILMVLLASLFLGSLGRAQNAPEKKPQPAIPQPAYELADALAERLGSELHVKTAVGEPIKVGNVTLIPIVMINVSFGGGGMAAPGGPPATAPGGQPAAQPVKPGLSVDGFYMSGEARPLGFVVVSKKGTRFIGVGKTPGK